MNQHCLILFEIRLLSDSPLSWLDPQIQFKLPINAIPLFVIPSVTLHVAKVQKTQSESPVELSTGQPNQKIGNFDILC